MFREPGKTVASIVRECMTRTYLKNFHITPEGAYNLWNHMYLGVLRWNEMFQGRFLFLHYNQILENQANERLEGFLETNIEKGFADPALNRSVMSGKAPRKTRRIYSRLCHLAGYYSPS